MFFVATNMKKIYWHWCGCPVSFANGIHLPLWLLLLFTSK